MKLAVVTPCLYPDTTRIHFLADSARKHGVALHPLGVGQQFADWRQMTLGVMVPGMRALLKESYDHALYLDGSDTILLADLEEIQYRYLKLGAPTCLFSAQKVVYPDHHFAIEYPTRWRFPNAGCCIANIRYWCDLMESIADRHQDDGNPQSWLVKEWNNFGATLDYDCEIFQTVEGCRSVRFLPDGVAINRITGTFPCVLHFPGGYSDPETGRDERIYPYWRQLYGE